MPKINENREEDLDREEEEEEESPAEDEDTEDSDSDTEDEEESEDDDSKDEADEDESEDESEDDQEEGEKGKFVMPEKFKGKSPEEIVKAYQNLEGMVGQKALEMAQAFLTKQGIKAKPEDGKKKEDDEFDLGLTDEEIAKMTPKEFARHMNRKITEKATEIARDAIERSNEVKTNVAREIKAATKLHPHLKTNKEYRELVLDIIEAGNAKGKVITLKEACEKANKALNVKPGESKADEGDKKKKKPAVEKQDGSDGKPMKTEEQRVKEGMMNAGSSTFLGGLGV